MALALGIVAVIGAVACQRTAAPTHVVVVGIDGATWRAIDPLIARGELPTFTALRTGAATGDLLSLPPYNSPQMWTSISTGQPPGVHGIENFTARAADGHAIPSSSNLRRVPAAWNIASSFGRRVGVVGWYVTWPAEAVNGFVVSDHVRPAEESATFWPVSSDQEARLTRRTYPPALLGAVAPLFVAPADVRRPEMREGLAFFGLKHPYLGDETYMRIALSQLAAHDPDLLLVYQHGTDVMQHLSFGPFEDWIRGEAEESRGARRVADYYRYEDDNLRRLIEAMGGRLATDGSRTRIELPSDRMLMVVSDHGFGPGHRPLQPALTGDHLPEGVLAMVGGPARPSARVTGATVLDVLPTVLHVLDLPLSRSLPGRVLVDGLEAGRRPERVDAGYPFRPAGGDPLASPLDAGILDELRSLGYIP